MEFPIAINNWFSLVDSFLQPNASPAPPLRAPLGWHAVTISRQTGCGADPIANKLAELLHQRSRRQPVPWKVFDRNLMDQVLADHNLPTRLARFLPEDRVSDLHDVMNELLGLHPGSRTIAEQISETVLRLAELGNVILIGRGANVITAKLPGVFHVRLVAPLADRIRHAQQFYNLSRKAAEKFCEQEDLGRKRFLKKYFGADIDNPLLYHLTVNTSLMPFDEVAQLIARTMFDQADHAPVPQPAYAIRAA